MLTKRTVIFKSYDGVIGSTYDTAANGWTLAALQIGDAEQKTNYVEKTGGDGSWDWSTVMTDGLPRYKDRSLSITLEQSEGTRTEREARVREVVNLLDGLEWEITLPDQKDYYLIGRLHVAVDYSDYAHASITITGTCRPWFYSQQEKVILLSATSTEKIAFLVNAGRLALVPTLEVADGSVGITYGTQSIQLSAGKYEWPTLLLTPGNHTLKYKGSGTLTITYREAVLR